MASQVPAIPVQEPFPIFTLAHKFIIYDPNVIAHIRQTYNIAGVLIGSLPQAPQQNVFLGAPLELMPEEARILVEKNVAFIVDDVKAHKEKFLNGGLTRPDRQIYQESLQKAGTLAADQATKRAEDSRKAGLAKRAQQTPTSGDWNDIPDDMLRPTTGPRKKSGMDENTPDVDNAKTQETEDESYEALFDSPAEQSSQKALRYTTRPNIPPYPLTPTTSEPPLAYTTTPRNAELPQVPKSYSLYKYMHSKDYFLAPGLRFGCQYMAYPGDPLRFHSHFLCSGMDWDQEFDLLDLVGGGRLGTGVKKGYLIGGQTANDSKDGDNSSVRVFCLEWGGM